MKKNETINQSLPMRIALVTSSLTGDELKAGKRDSTHIYTLLTDNEIGRCSHERSDILTDIEDRNKLQNRICEIIGNNWDVRDQFIFYFSGHGIIRKKKYCLLFGDKLLPFRNIIEDLGALGVNRAILILDTCQSGGAVDALKEGIKGGEEDIISYIPDIPKGIAILASSKKNEVSNEITEGSHSVFTSLFCEALETGLNGTSTADGLISVGDLVTFITDKLDNEDKYSDFNQRPTYYTEGAGREIWIAKNKTPTSNLHSNTTEAKFITSSEELELLYKQRLHQEHPCLNKSAVTNLDFNLLEKYTGQIFRETPPISILSDYGLTSDIPHNGQIYLHNSAVLCFCKQPSNFIRGSSESTFYIGKKTDVINITHIKGPLSKQIEELFALSLSSGEYFQKTSFIDKNANLIVGLGISEELIRELISNAITHRDYQSPGNVIVRITEDFFEIENPGHFPDGVSWSNLINNEDTRSYPINFSIHQYLKRLLKFEGIGRGFETIREYIKNYGNESISCETPLPGSCIRIRVLRPKNFTGKFSKYISNKNDISDSELSSRAFVLLENRSISIILNDIGLNETRSINDQDITYFKSWINTYNRNLEKIIDNNNELLSIGEGIYSWLNGTDNWIERIIDNKVQPPFIVEYCISNSTNMTFLEIPWELLAKNGHFLAEDPYIQYCPIRRIGKPSMPSPPSDFRLSTVFMAAAPFGSDVLAYEEEEATLVEATETVGIDLVIVESGELSRLAEAMYREKPVDVLHISCHGEKPEHSSESFLFFEDEKGDIHKITPKELSQILSHNNPRMLFLSSCMTSTPNESLNSFSSEMIKFGIPAVLGWAGKVSDSDATLFSSYFYKQLSQGHSIENSTAIARNFLFSSQKVRYWHMPRLYIAKSGGGVLSAGQKSRRITQLDRGFKEFLNAKGFRIPVAGRNEFVGRRREIQKILKIFRINKKAGVVIHGFARIGKSSLAARIANRMIDHKIIVIYGHYDASTILKAFVDSLSISRVKEIVDKYLSVVRTDPIQFRFALRELLEGPCREIGESTKPILLIIDDLEKILVLSEKTGMHQFKPEFIDIFQSLIQAFNNAETLSKLLITSRYRFNLPSYRGTEASKQLFFLHLPPLNLYEGRKLASAKLRNINEKKYYFKPNIVEKSINVASGNPGILNLLLSLGIENQDEESFMRILHQMESYIQKGLKPNEEKLSNFVNSLAINSLINSLSSSEMEFLKASNLFNIPTPVDVFLHLEITLDDKFSEKLISLGLWDTYQDIVYPDQIAVAINSFVKPNIELLTDDEKVSLAKTIIRKLFECWGGASNRNRPAIADYELTRLGILANNPDILSITTKPALIWLKNQFNYILAAQFARESIAILDKEDFKVNPTLLSEASECCQQVGDIYKASEFISRSLNILSSDRDREKDKHVDKEFASASLRYGRMLVQSGNLEEAITCFEQCVKIFEELGERRERAITLGDIARIRVSRGEVDEALALHHERFKIFEELGDRRERAITLGDIARIRVDRGEIDEALKLYEEELEIYEALGDRRSRAITLGDIARIRVSKGEVDEALRLHEEELLVFEELGDRRSRAVTLGDIARIRLSKGEVDGALKIHEEMLEVFEALGDRRSMAVALGDIARIKKAKGEIDEAFKLNEERLEIFERLGDSRSRAITLCEIAQIKVGRGEVDKALELHREALQIFEKLGDIREKSVALGDIARILVSKGEHDNAIKLHQERLVIAQNIGDIDGIAATHYDLGQIEWQREQYQNAFEHLSESYSLYIKIDRIDGISFVGIYLGVLLCQAGQSDQGLEILNRSRDGFLKLGQTSMAEQAEQLVNQMDTNTLKKEDLEASTVKLNEHSGERIEKIEL